MNCCIVGVGNHASKNLIPSLQRLVKEGLVKIKYVCRKSPEKGDSGIGAPVISHFPKDVDFLVGCGHPNLHKSLIDFSNECGIPCFVEKPHLIVPQKVNDRVMIGYNFNFVEVLPKVKDFTTVDCGTKGLYESWPDIFSGKISKYQHAFHSVIVHPLSVVIQRYGKPQSVTLTDSSSDDNVNVSITLNYDNNVSKYVNYSTEWDAFGLDLIEGSTIVKCKLFKSESYYHMLKNYVQSDFKPTINNSVVGEHTLWCVNQCLKQINVS